MNRMPEIEAMYALMNEDGRSYLHGMARQLLRSFPKQSGHHLLPCAKQPDQVQLLNDDSHGAVYQFPLVCIREPIHGKQADIG